MSKHWLHDGWCPQGLIVHHQLYQPSDGNKNVAIEYSAYDSLLE
jgi:hypothetical protein